MCSVPVRFEASRPRCEAPMNEGQRGFRVRFGVVSTIGVLAIGLGLAAASLRAEIYRWTDGQGREHFTQDLNQVPPSKRPAAKQQAGASLGPGRVSRYTITMPASPARPRATPAAAPPKKVYRIPVQRAGTSMMVNARLNNSVNATFLIDTGASDVLMPQAVADQLGLEVGPETRTKRYTTANGMVEHPVVMLRSVSLGGAEVRNVPASISPHMSVGLLGLSFFNHFTYEIDAARGIVTLVPNGLEEAGGIRGGRSEAQWRAEYKNLHYRRLAAQSEKERTPPNHSREHRRLEEVVEELDRQEEILEAEADQARVPMVWRN